MTGDAPIKVVGWGPFRMPGEKKRWARAEVAAQRMLKLAGKAEQRAEEDSEPRAVED